MRIQYLATLGALLMTVSGLAVAGEADVIDVRAVPAADGTWSFDVTVKHADEGWDHYANRWDVMAPDGTVLGTRTLHHPHENEQPFTRSLRGVRVPETIRSVTIRANDSIHGTGGREFSVTLPR